MSNEAMLLIVTGLLAVVAVAAAVIAVVAMRAARRVQATPPTTVEPAPPQTSTEVAVRHDVATTRVIEGRVIATPTEQQVVATALGRPAVRLSIVAAGLGHALRPESRDRISGLMRREYRHRRRTRRRIARRAARAVPAEVLQREDSWLGTSSTDLADHRQLRSTETDSMSSKAESMSSKAESMSSKAESMSSKAESMSSKMVGE